MKYSVGDKVMFKLIGMITEIKQKGGFVKYTVEDDASETYRHAYGTEENIEKIMEVME